MKSAQCSESDSPLHIELRSLQQRIDRMRNDRREEAHLSRLERDSLRWEHDAELRSKDRQMESARYQHRLELDGLLNENEMRIRDLEEDQQVSSDRMIKKEIEHCNSMRDALDKAAADQKVLHDKLLEMQKQVTTFTEKKAQDNARMFRTISRILIETMTNYEIEKESAKIREHQNELLGVFSKLETALDNIHASDMHPSTFHRLDKIATEFDNALNRLIASMCSSTSISPDERRVINRVLLDIEHAVHIFKLTLSSRGDEILRRSSFDLFRSLICRMSIVKSNHVEEHVTRSLQELSSLMSGVQQDDVQIDLRSRRLPVEHNDDWNLESLRRDLEAERMGREEFLQHAALLSKVVTEESEAQIRKIKDASERARWTREEAEKACTDKQAAHQRTIETLKSRLEEDREAYERELALMEKTHLESVQKIDTDTELRLKELTRDDHSRRSEIELCLRT